MNMGTSTPRAVVTTALVLVGCRGLLDLPAIGEPLDEDAGFVGVDANGSDAVTADAPSRACATVSLPAEGTYRYYPIDPTAHGQEHAWQLDQTGTKEGDTFGTPSAIPPLGDLFFNAVLKYTDDGTFVQTFYMNDQHIDEFTFQAKPASGLQVVNVKQVSFGQLTINAHLDPPVDAIKCVMTPNETWLASPTGTLAVLGNNGTFNVASAFTYIVDTGVFGETVTVDGHPVPTYHLHETRSLTGGLFGTQESDYWFARNNGLLVQAKFATGDLTSGKVDGVKMNVVPNLPVEYKGHAEFVLQKLDPIPPPDAGPPADSGVKDSSGGAKKDG